MDVLVPLEITDTQLLASSVAEPSAGEVAWVNGTTYALGDKVVRSTTHRVYTDTQGGVSTVAPENDPVRWPVDITQPTNRWAWADGVVSTATVADSPFSIDVQPGTVADVSLFGLSNVDVVRCQQWDDVGGDLVFDQLFSTEDVFGADPYWAFFFDLPRQRSKLDITGLLPSQTGRILLTMSSFDGDPVSVGLAAFGSFESTGCAEFGFTASPVDYSRVVIDDYGNNTIKKGKSAKDLKGVVHMPIEQANTSAALVYRLLGTPVVVRVGSEAAYDFLSGYGLLSADVTAEGPTHATLSATLKGLI